MSYVYMFFFFVFCWGKKGEYHTIGRVSHSTDYISRRLEIRCDIKKMFDHGKVYCHMIHGLVCSTERLLCCLLEVHQTPEVYSEIAQRTKIAQIEY